MREAAVAALAALTDAADAADSSAALVAAALDPAAPHAVRRAAFAVLPASAIAAGTAPRAAALEAALEQLRRPDMRGQVHTRARAEPAKARGVVWIRAPRRGGASRKKCAAAGAAAHSRLVPWPLPACASAQRTHPQARSPPNAPQRVL